MKGFINIYKPSGMSSAAVVSIVKRKLNTPCGHFGTLDPMAEGILPVGIYKTTRLFDYTLDKEKQYTARFVFGKTTDTLDTTGNISAECEVFPTSEQIKSILPEFIGDIMQVPPKFSAKCIDGKRGYALARRGVDFELAPKKVRINNITLKEQISKEEFEFVIDCKGGTYIRSLARDIANRCGTVGVMSKLVRTKVGVFNIENSVPLSEFKETDAPEKYILPADIAVDYEKLVLTSEQATKILNGVFENYGYADGIYRVYNENEFWGIGISEKGVLKIKAYVR